MRYWPGRRCVVQWTFANPESSQPIIISAELLAENAAARGRNGLGTYVADRRVWLQVFPHDSVLPAIETAASQVWVQELLRPRTSLAGADLTIQPVSYKSWRRCVLQYTLRSGSYEQRFFGKLFRDDRGAGLFRTLNELTLSLKSQAVGWTTPETVLYDPETRMLLTSELKDATSLSDVMRLAMSDDQASLGLLSSVKQAGRELARFQNIAIEGLEEYGSEEIVSSLLDDVEDIALVAPATGEILKKRVEVLATMVQTLTPERLALSHGAFRHSHVYQSPGGLAFLDLDNLRMSGVNADAGYFLAYLAFRSAKRNRTKPISDQCTEVFRAAWMEEDGYDPRWLSFHSQAVLLKWAIRAFFSLDASWPELLPRVADLCAEVDQAG